MNRATRYMLIAAMLTVGVIGSFAVNSFAAVPEVLQLTVTGKIINLETQLTEPTLTIVDKEGKNYVIGFDNASMVEGLKVGDEATVKYQNEASSIMKVGDTTSGSSNKSE